MNILYIALLMCVVCHVFVSGSDVLDVDKQVVPRGAVGEEEDIATNPEVREFVKAMQKGDMEAAYTVFRSCDSDKLKEYCGKHLINHGISRLVELIKGVAYKSWILGVILVYGGRELFDKVSADTDTTDDVLSSVANSADLASNTDQLFYLLGKMTGTKDQERAVRWAAGALVHANKLEHLDHMLFALESKPSLGLSMKNVAIKRAFYWAFRYTDGRVLTVKRFFDHPAILAKDYSDAIYWADMSEDPKHELFHWLLAQADRQDLERVKSDGRFPHKLSEFQGAVIKALEAVGAEARIGIRCRAETIKSLTGLLPKALFDIIFGYYSDSDTI